MREAGLHSRKSSHSEAETGCSNDRLYSVNSELIVVVNDIIKEACVAVYLSVCLAVLVYGLSVCLSV